MTLYGNSESSEIMPDAHSHDMQCGSPAGRRSADKLKCNSPPIKRQCSNNILSEYQTNIPCYERSLFNKSTSCGDDESLSSSPREHTVLTSSPVNLSVRCSPVKSSVICSPVKFSASFSNKENATVNDNSPVSVTDVREQEDKLQSKDDTCSKSPAKKRNIFAVGSNAGLRPRFSLNESKITKNEVETRLEVRSR